MNKILIFFFLILSLNDLIIVIFPCPCSEWTHLSTQGRSSFLKNLHTAGLPEVVYVFKNFLLSFYTFSAFFSLDADGLGIY